MSEMDLRQKAAVAVVGVIVLYAIAAASWFMSAESAWKKAAGRYRTEVARHAREEALIADKRKWDAAYESAKSAMPTFAIDQATDTTWLRKVEELAKTNRVLITDIDAGQEVEADDVLELPIEVRTWEGSLEALVRFMYALETSSGDGMFDVSEISLKPSNKQGYLKGSLTVTCAYMRENANENAKTK